MWAGNVEIEVVLGDLSYLVMLSVDLGRFVIDVWMWLNSKVKTASV